MSLPIDFLSVVLRGQATRRRCQLWGAGVFAVGALLASCKSAEKGKVEAHPSASSAASVAATSSSTPAPKKPSAKEAAKVQGMVPDDSEVQPIVNSRKLAPYSGKTGTVRGIVRATGDRSADLPKVLAKIEASCGRAREVYGTLFREGKARELADVLVAVTGYDGYVPIKTKEVQVWGNGCAWNSRTIVATLGQRLAIGGLDNRPYVPEILGQKMPAQLFVLPAGKPVELGLRRPGRFQLVDSMRLYAVADLFVLAYATIDVTEVDGKYEISGVPVGKVTVNAMLPQTEAVAGKEITIVADQVTEVNFDLAFDRKAWDKLEKPTPLDEIPGPDPTDRR